MFFWPLPKLVESLRMLKYPAEFIYENLAIQTNIIHQSYMFGAKKLLFLGSSCIYPQMLHNR
jgi:nucleoside-diphosphate-sugar epimerase